MFSFFHFVASLCFFFVFFAAASEMHLGIIWDFMSVGRKRELAESSVAVCERCHCIGALSSSW